MIETIAAAATETAEVTSETAEVTGGVASKGFENISPFSDSARPTEGNMELPKLKDSDRLSEARQFSDSDRPSDSMGVEQPQLKSATDTSNKTENMEQQNPHEEVRDGKTYYYDANGDLYRVDNDLVPDNEYVINGYKYETDENGRIISAEGDLHLKDRDSRLPIKDSIEDIGKGDQKANDDRGHLIGDQFDGSNGLENLVSQDANINRNDFKNFENELAKEVKDGKTVHVKVEPVYDGDSHRPSALVVTYSIDGEESVRVFPNDKEEQ